MIATRSGISWSLSTHGKIERFEKDVERIFSRYGILPPSATMTQRATEADGDKLRRKLLRASMKEAGVTSDPEVTFHTGGFGKLY